MINFKCDYCTNIIRKKKYFTCKQKRFRKESYSNEKVYHHKYDRCEDFNPNFNTFNGFTHVIGRMDKELIKPILEVLVRTGLIAKVLKRGEAAAIVNDVEGKFILVSETLEMKGKKKIIRRRQR